MREGLFHFVFSLSLFGITPAYAGRTKNLAGLFRRDRDHPRLCGKDRRMNDKLKPCPGSPPLMREGLKDDLQEPTDNGITPAYAGRTINN